MSERKMLVALILRLNFRSFSTFIRMSLRLVPKAWMQDFQILAVISPLVLASQIVGVDCICKSSQ